MTTSARTEIEAQGLERRAAVLERQADEREGRAVWDFGGGSRFYYQTLDRAEQYRREARELREQATRLRRQPNRR